LKSYNNTIFINALTKTAEHRETTHIFNEISNRVETIKNSVALKKGGWNTRKVIRMPKISLIWK